MGFASKPSECAQVQAVSPTVMAWGTQSPPPLILKIWGPRLSFLGFQTCALPRCPSTRQPPSPSRPSRYPRPKSSSSVSTEPAICSMKRSGASQLCSCGGYADVREHQNTNIVKFHGLLKKGSVQDSDGCPPYEQVTYYQVRVAFGSVPIDLSIIS